MLKDDYLIFSRNSMKSFLPAFSMFDFLSQLKNVEITTSKITTYMC